MVKYHGKQVSADLFEAVWDDYRMGKCRIEDAAYRLGITPQSFRNWKKELVNNNFCLVGVHFIDQSTL